jgi:hypothetical protein
MTYGLAQRNTQHSMGVADAVYTPRWRVTGSLVIAKGTDGRGQYAYGGDTLDWLSDEQAAHLLRHKLVEPIDADAQAATTAAVDAPAQPLDPDRDAEDSDAPAADSDAVAECIGVLEQLQVPATVGAPAARTALRGNGFRFGNAVVAAAVKRRKLSRTATDADDEQFEAVVM